MLGQLPEPVSELGPVPRRVLLQVPEPWQECWLPGPERAGWQPAVRALYLPDKSQIRQDS